MVILLAMDSKTCLVEGRSVRPPTVAVLAWFLQKQGPWMALLPHATSATTSAGVAQVKRVLFLCTKDDPLTSPKNYLWIPYLSIYYLKISKTIILHHFYQKTRNYCLPFIFNITSKRLISCYWREWTKNEVNWALSFLKASMRQHVDSQFCDLTPFTEFGSQKTEFLVRQPSRAMKTAITVWD